MDFGLAKLARPEGAERSSEVETRVADTDPGAVLGTVGYMAPEQVRGEPVDHRADIFSFGCILYEMLAARKAFSKASGVETLNAILTEDPPDLAASNPAPSPALQRLIGRCLEKNPTARFQSASDLAFALDALSSSSSSSDVEVRGEAAAPAALTAASRWRSLPWLVAAMAVIAAALALTSLLARGSPPPTPRVRFQVNAPEGGSFQSILGTARRSPTIRTSFPTAAAFSTACGRAPSASCALVRSGRPRAAT